MDKGRRRQLEKLKFKKKLKNYGLLEEYESGSGDVHKYKNRPPHSFEDDKTILNKKIKHKKRFYEYPEEDSFLD